MCYGFGGPSYLRYGSCSGGCIVRAIVLSDVRIVFDEVCAIVVLGENSVQVLGSSSSVKLSCESQTICALLVTVRTVVALCEVVIASSTYRILKGSVSM